MTIKRGALIAVEGLDGAGKTSNIRNIENYLSHGDTPHFVASEYMDNTVCASIRNLLNTQKGVLPLPEILMFYASRLQHTESIIAPYLESGHHVICDRYYGSTLAYQGVRFPDVKKIHNCLKDYLIKPDLVLLLDIPVDTYRERVLARSGKLDVIESRALDYFEKVRNNFLELAQLENYVVIDATKPLDQVFAETTSKIEDFLRNFDENQH